MSEMCAIHSYIERIFRNGLSFPYINKNTSLLLKSYLLIYIPLDSRETQNCFLLIFRDKSVISNKIFSSLMIFFSKLGKISCV